MRTTPSPATESVVVLSNSHGDFLLHTCPKDPVFHGFSGRVRQLVLQGVDTATQADWVASFLAELRVHMRKCEFQVVERPEPWFPTAPGAPTARYLYVIVNKGVKSVDDVDASSTWVWHVLEDRQFATQQAFLTMSTDRPVARPTSVGRLMTWDGSSVVFFNMRAKALARLNTANVTSCVQFGWVVDGVVVSLVSVCIGAAMQRVLRVDNPPVLMLLERGHADGQLITVCMRGVADDALRAQLPCDTFDLYMHEVPDNGALVNTTDDDVVVCHTQFCKNYYMCNPGGAIRARGGRVVCSEGVLACADK